MESFDFFNTLLPSSKAQLLEASTFIKVPVGTKLYSQGEFPPFAKTVSEPSVALQLLGLLAKVVIILGALGAVKVKGGSIAGQVLLEFLTTIL